MNSGESNSALDKPTIQLHPAQVNFLEKMESKYCEGSTKGKGIRCIIDYLRENEDVQDKVLAEKPKYTEGFVPWQMTHIHDRQLDFLGGKGIKLKSGEDVDKFEDVGKSLR